MSRDSVTVSEKIKFQGPPLLPNLQQKIYLSRQGLFCSNFQEKDNGNLGNLYYLHNPATARKLMKRTRPAQTPPRPNSGATTSRNADEIAPAKN